MRVALVIPCDFGKRQGQYHNIPQLGVGYLAACLLEAGMECRVFDAKMERLSRDEIHRGIRSYRPDLVGFSAMTHEINLGHEIAREIKEYLPRAASVIGGCHATALPERTLREFPAFDYAAVGEGERTVVELASRLSGGGDPGTVRGLVYRRGGEILDAGRRDFIEDLDSIPFPAWNLFPRTHIYPVYTSRGCPFRCNFCMRVLGGSVRFRSTAKVIEELRMLIDRYGARDIRFRDETFNVNRARVLELIDQMMAHGMEKKVVWSVTTHASTVDEELLRRMKAAGCVKVGFGIESGSEEILRGMGKRLSKEKAREAIRAARRAGIESEAYFILGHPNETLETIRETQRFAVELNPTKVNFGSMVPYPGTSLYDMAVGGGGGYRILSYDWGDWDKYLGNAVEIEGLPRAVLEREQVRSYILFYLKNRRILPAVRFFWIHRAAIVTYIGRMLRRRSRAPRPSGENLS